MWFENWSSQTGAFRRLTRLDPPGSAPSCSPAASSARESERGWGGSTGCVSVSMYVGLDVWQRPGQPHQLSTIWAKSMPPMQDHKVTMRQTLKPNSTILMTMRRSLPDSPPSSAPSVSNRPSMTEASKSLDLAWNPGKDISPKEGSPIDHIGTITKSS